METVIQSLSKQEAIKALQEGKRVAHSYYFESGEFLEQKGSFYYNEKHYQIDPFQFWFCRAHFAWEEGWRILES